MTDPDNTADDQRTLTGQQAAEHGRKILEAAGVDLDALTRRRDTQLAPMANILTAARHVIDNLGTPGMTDRAETLRDAIQHAVQLDPVTAVLVTSALWIDSYNTSGSTVRLMDLQDAVDDLTRGT